MTKFLQAAQVIEERILNAERMATGVPSERQLAEELGLSRNTVRKAVQRLIEQGALGKDENGRLDIPELPGKPKVRTIGFIAPTGISRNRDKWFESLNDVVGGLSQSSVVARSVAYTHWGDAAIQDALANCDGAFLMTPAERVPDWLLTRIRQSPCRLVSLDHDHTAESLPSVLIIPPRAERRLFDHLRRFGHQRIDCLNTQAVGQVIEGRISCWRDYLSEHRFSGQLLSNEVRRPADSAYQLVRDALIEGRELASALFCTTGPAALGAMRALHEAGLKIGDDVSVCTVNSEGLGRLLLRTLTAIEPPPRALFLSRACKWMLGESEWGEALLIQPEDVPFFEGESTGPVPAHSLPAAPRDREYQPRSIA